MAWAWLAKAKGHSCYTKKSTLAKTFMKKKQVKVRSTPATTLQKKDLYTKIAADDGGGRVVRRCWVNFQCRGVLLIRIIVGQGPIALVVGAGRDCLDIFFSHLSLLFSFSLPLGDGPI